jgi:hypothetical protein
MRQDCLRRSWSKNVSRFGKYPTILFDFTLLDFVALESAGWRRGLPPLRWGASSGRRRIFALVDPLRAAGLNAGRAECHDQVRGTEGVYPYMAFGHAATASTESM